MKIIEIIFKGDFLIFIATILTALATYFVYRATIKLKETADGQMVATLISNFQDEWHNEQSIAMREWLNDIKFKNILNEALCEVYGTGINHKNINELISKKITIDDQTALEKFENKLKETPCPNEHAGGFVFTAYGALYKTLLSFDRLATLRNKPQAFEIIWQYRPPIRDMAELLLPFSSKITL